MNLEDARKIILQDTETRKAYEEIKWRYRIGQVITNRRQKLNLSQRELAERCKLKQPQIVRIEQGENVSLDTLEKVASSLDLEFDLIPREAIQQ
jgi:transcriptional regulator with XRE-family HTH domain